MINPEHRKSRAALVGQRIRFSQPNALVTGVEHHDDATSTLTFEGDRFEGKGTLRLADNVHLGAGSVDVYWENEELIAALTEMLDPDLFDVEEWHTGGGVQNPVVILRRDALGDATHYLMFSDGGEIHGFALVARADSVNREVDDINVNLVDGNFRSARAQAESAAEFLAVITGAFGVRS